MRISFSQPIFRHRYSMRCVPHDTKRQKIKELELTIKPENKVNFDTDAFGNILSYGCIDAAHTDFDVSLCGTAETGLDIYEHDGGETDIFRVQSQYTRPGAELRGFYDELRRAAPDDPYLRVLYFMRSVHYTMRYTPNSTDVCTTAEEAFASRRGVCQDYAQILISLLRLDGIPARYAAGMMIGEGATHAWIEAYLGGRWYGFDPTNNLLIDSYYIKISHGRDYHDCAVSRGVFFGISEQTQEIYVTVEEVE